jgi:hypothetical protein
MICTNCQDLLSERMYGICKHPRHPTKRKRSDEDRRFVFITAQDYFKTYKDLNLRPNAAICKQYCIVNHLNDVFEEEAVPADKNQVLSGINAARSAVSPVSVPLAFNKRNRNINMNDNEVEIDFWKNATPNKPGALFTREDKSCWIPIAHLLKKLAPPKASRTGRTVSVCINEQKLFDQLLSSRLVW